MFNPGLPSSYENVWISLDVNMDYNNPKQTLAGMCFNALFIIICENDQRVIE
ncbi:MAG: hypothetical protein ACYCQI_12060 [Gammaproteobacteria bacterium]